MLKTESKIFMVQIIAVNAVIAPTHPPLYGPLTSHLHRPTCTWDSHTHQTPHPHEMQKQ